VGAADAGVICTPGWQGEEDWRVHEGNTVVGGGNDGDGVLIKHDIGARWPTHQTGESDSPRDSKWKGAEREKKRDPVRARERERARETARDSKRQRETQREGQRERKIELNVPVLAFSPEIQ
jgi:hypothetical protein